MRQGRQPGKTAHPSHGSWPHRELHRRLQWQGSHGGPAPFRRTPREGRGGPMRTSTESGTHNVVLTTAYGWALRQANSTLVSFPPHSPSPPPDLMFFSCWPLPSPSPQSPSPSIHSVNNTQRNYTGVNPQRHATAKPEKRIEAKPENQGGGGAYQKFFASAPRNFRGHWGAGTPNGVTNCVGVRDAGGGACGQCHWGFRV